MRSFLSRATKKESNVSNKNDAPNHFNEKPMKSIIKGTNAMRLGNHNNNNSNPHKIHIARGKYYNPNNHKQAESNTNSISTNTQSNNENLVNGREEVREKLGSGSFGEVRLAMDIKTQLQVAVKFEHKSDIKKHLNTEYRVYLKLKDAIGFPAIYWFGKYGDYTALVMDRLGVSLKTLYSRCNRIFPVQTVSLIAIQLLDRLEILHNGGWLHQDLKPENIVIGYGTNLERNILYLIDYGTSDEFIDSMTKKHRLRAPSSKIVGTARYSSLNNHYGYKQSRRDDLESLGYTLIYWLLGRLPWQGIDEKDFRIKWKKVRRIKRSITPDELCRGLPVQFRIYIKYVFKLSYSQRPNYGYLRGLFRQLIPNGNSGSADVKMSDEIKDVSEDNVKDNINNSAKKFAWQKFGIKCE